jgi:hypothetical protein
MPAYELTVDDARNDVAIKQISGVCSDSDEFLALLNEAEKSLAIRGGWFDLQQRIHFCLTGCCIVWPDFVGTILGIRFCGGLAQMQNQWYSFVNNDMGQNLNAAYGFGSGYGDGFTQSWGGSGTYAGRSACVVEDAGTAPCYNEITGSTGKYVRYYIVKPEDIGKKITIFGKQYGGQPLQEKDANGNWVMGVTLTAASPFASTAMLVTEITAVTREETQGTAMLYEYDPVANKLRDLSAYKPYETNPRYRASRILNRSKDGKKDENGVCWTSIEALCKLKFLPLKHDRDFLPISNLRAVKLAMQGIKLEQEGNDQAGAVKWALALEELALEQEDKQPKKSIPVRMGLGRTLASPI